MQHTQCGKIADEAECRWVAHRIAICVASALLLLMALRFYDGLANCFTNGRTPLIIVEKDVRWWRHALHLVPRKMRLSSPHKSGNKIRWWVVIHKNLRQIQVSVFLYHSIYTSQKIGIQDKSISSRKFLKAKTRLLIHRTSRWTSSLSWPSLPASPIPTPRLCPL